MAQTVGQALASTVFYSDSEEYTLIRLPPAAMMAAAGVIAEIGEPFCALIRDKDEISLILPTAAWDDFKQRLPGHRLGEIAYRLLTLDVELEPTLTGFMAVVSRALADAGVSILPLAAFSRDHLFVPAAQFEIALDALKQLQSKDS